MPDTPRGNARRLAKTLQKLADKPKLRHSTKYVTAECDPWLTSGTVRVLRTIIPRRDWSFLRPTAFYRVRSALRLTSSTGKRRPPRLLPITRTLCLASIFVSSPAERCERGNRSHLLADLSPVRHEVHLTGVCLAAARAREKEVGLGGRGPNRSRCLH